MARRYFFDTYALIEIGKGNPKYEPYKEDVVIILSKLNLLEFSYYLFKENRTDEIKEIFERYLKYDFDYDQDIIVKAAEMKFKFLKERLSFIDCLGYFIAKKNNAKFLTGDEKFKGMENVEFVK